MNISNFTTPNQDVRLRNKSRSETKFFGSASLALLGVSFFPSPSIQTLVVLALIGTGSFFVFHASTWVATGLTGFKKNVFQWAVVLTAPLILSIFFIMEAYPLSVEGVLSGYSWWFLIQLTFFAFVAWHAASQLDEKYPFRGYLIAAGLLFIINFLWHIGLSSGDDLDGGSYFDFERWASNRQSGRYFLNYLTNCGTVYCFMYFKMRRLSRMN